jgi:dihydrofolate reductase
MEVILISAIDRVGSLGGDGDLIWSFPNDLKRFKSLTLNNWVVMGRKTFESIGKPLPNRKTCIITRNPDYKTSFENILIQNSLESAINSIKGLNDDGDIYIIGGGEIYKEALLNNIPDRLEITHIDADYSDKSDTFLDMELLKSGDWVMTSSIDCFSDEKHNSDYNFSSYLNRVNFYNILIDFLMENIGYTGDVGIDEEVKSSLSNKLKIELETIIEELDMGIKGGISFDEQLNEIKYLLNEGV